MHRNIQPDWQGKQKNDFTKQWETFSSDYTNFQTEMNTFYDTICNEITRLENKKNEENGIIQATLERVQVRMEALHAEERSKGL